MKEYFEYLSANPYSCPGTQLIGPEGVVVHFVNNPGTSAMANRDYFEGLKTGVINPKKGRPDYGSVHDIVGLDGEVVHCIRYTQRAYHCGATQPIKTGSLQYYTDLVRNRWPQYSRDHLHQSPNTILLGIEYCHTEATGKPNQKTLDSLSQLLAKHCTAYGFKPQQDVFLHEEIVGYKNCPKWFCNHPAAWQELLEMVERQTKVIGEKCD